MDDMEYKVPEIWIAALSMIGEELNRIMWNINQKEYDSPFENTGNRFDECDEFTVEAFSWNDDYEQPYNFKWKDVGISWYKHLRRCTTANKELSPDLASEMLINCLNALKKYESTKGHNIDE